MMRRANIIRASAGLGHHNIDLNGRGPGWGLSPWAWAGLGWGLLSPWRTLPVCPGKTWYAPVCSSMTQYAPVCSGMQGCARLMNQRQHDSSYRPLAMDSSPQLPSGTNYTTSTIVPSSNRTHYRQNRTTAYQRHSRSWQAASRVPSSPLWRC